MFSRSIVRRLSRKTSRRSAKNPVGIERLEPRQLFSSTILGTLTLPGANQSWDATHGDNEASPVMADLNGDGVQEVIVACADGKVRAYDYSAGSASKTTLFATYDTGSSNPIQNTPVVVQIPNVGATVWFGDNSGKVYGFNGVTGASLITPFQIPDNRSPNLQDGQDQVYASLSSIDLTGDGIPEIIANDFNHELTAISLNLTAKTASVYWQLNNDDTTISSPAIGDINGDLQPDIVAGGDSSPSPFYWAGGRVNAVSADGRREWMYQTDQTIFSSPALADLKGDGKLETVVGTGYFYPQPNVAPYPGNEVFAINPDGSTDWVYTTEASGTDGRVFASPAIGDLNGDNKLDVVVVDAHGVVHAINGQTGAAIWTMPIASGVNNYSSPILADWTGTGRQDVIIATGPTLYVLNGQTGAIIETRNFNSQLFYNSVAVGHFTNSTSWQAILVSNGSNPSLTVHLSPTTMTILDLGNSSAMAPAWGQYRRDENHWAVERDPAFVQSIIKTSFDAFYKRDPTADEIAQFTPVFSNRPVLTYAIGSIVGSSAARTAEITSYYTTYIGRTPGQAEIDAWITQLAGGETYSNAQAGFVASPEFFSNSGGTLQTWITALYQNLLGRAPEPGAVDSWIGVLGSNTYDNRTNNVAIKFFLSQEKTAKRITDLFTNYHPFGMTTPSTTEVEMAGWVLRTGAREEYTYVQIFASLGHFENYHPISTVVYGFYEDFLGRAPTDAEWAGSVTQLEGAIGGGTPTDVALKNIAAGIQRSDEGRTLLIKGLYQYFLNRAATQNEISAGLSIIKGGGKVETIIVNILSSNEFFTNVAGSDTHTFIQKVYELAFGRDPVDSEYVHWSGTPNVRTVLPTQATMVNGSTPPTEFRNEFVSRFYLQLLRRLPKTPADGSRLIQSNAPADPGATTIANNWDGEGGFEGAELEVITGNEPGFGLTPTLAEEYRDLWLNKAIWLGARWLS